MNLPKIFCLTLKDTPKRKEYAENHFKQNGLDVEFFEGINGSTFGLRTIIPYRDDDPNGPDYFIKQGRIGCLLSHLMLWKTLLHNSYDEILILEDDIQLPNNFIEKFQELKNKLPNDWQYVFVGHCCLAPSEHQIKIAEGIVVTDTPPMCTHAYMVKKTSLLTLIETNSQAWAAVDIQIQKKTLKQLKYYIFEPAIVEQVSLLKQRTPELFDSNDKTFESLTLDSNFI